MSSPETFYRRVYASLKAYSDELNSIDAAINTSIRNCKAMCERADSMMQEELKQNAEKEVRLKAFIDIARSHCKKLIDSQESYQYDTGVLSRLSVQISNSSMLCQMKRLLISVRLRIRYSIKKTDLFLLM